MTVPSKYITAKDMISYMKICKYCAILQTWHWIQTILDHFAASIQSIYIHWFGLISTSIHKTHLWSRRIPQSDLLMQISKTAFLGSNLQVHTSLSGKLAFNDCWMVNLISKLFETIIFSAIFTDCHLKCHRYALQHARVNSLFMYCVYTEFIRDLSCI